ncbi:MAG: ArsR family transcriptional regulator [Pedobacter sp.]|nr:MAG: ArsR family transcriptional regulator [Pedobacter sp.]
MKPAKICYDHIGGKLGSLFMEKCIAEGWIKQTERSAHLFQITEKGTEEFQKLGLDLSQIKEEAL